MAAVGEAGRRLWNANLHYNGVLDRLVPAGARRVLDVGCGDGFLAARLSERVDEVIGLDLDGPVLERARARFPDARVEWMQADAMTAPLPERSFDAVVSNATLHHLDEAAALRRLAGLVPPGGTLAIVGFARNGLLDWPRALLGQAILLVLNVVLRKWEHSAPQHWPPAHTYGELHGIARRVLPGVRFRRLLLGRYLLVWRRPA